MGAGGEGTAQLVAQDRNTEKMIHGLILLEPIFFHFVETPPSRYLQDSGIEPTSPASPALADGFFTTVPTGKPIINQKSKLFS